MVGSLESCLNSRSLWYRGSGYEINEKDDMSHKKVAKQGNGIELNSMSVPTEKARQLGGSDGVPPCKCIKISRV